MPNGVVPGGFRVNAAPLVLQAEVRDGYADLENPRRR